jgi:hypothetical protein
MLNNYDVYRLNTISSGMVALPSSCCSQKDRTIRGCLVIVMGFHTHLKAELSFECALLTITAIADLVEIVQRRSNYRQPSDMQCST